MQFEEAAQKVLQFRDDRDWSQFHNPKDLAISINLESAELLELFQWSAADLEVIGKNGEMADELADILIYCIYLADRLGLDIPKIINDKVGGNAKRYPVGRASGNSRKYTKL